MEKKMYDLVVDEELERVAPPLAENELEILKADILEHGCKFPLIVWGDTIVDGHNRYHICKEADIPFAVEQMEFADKTEAKLWIVKNQLGRRNLKDYQRCEMVLPLEEEIKADVEKRRRAAISVYRKTGETDSTLNQSKRSLEMIADLAGVSVGTLFKVKLIISKGDDEQKSLLRSGEKTINYVYSKIRDREKPVQEKQPEPEAEASEEPDAEEEPSGFDEIREQLNYAFETFLSDLDYALEWLSGETATKENEAKIMDMIDEVTNKARTAVSKKMEEVK